MGGQINDIIKSVKDRINNLRAIERLINSAEFRIFYNESSTGIKKQLVRLIMAENLGVLKKWRKWHKRQKLETLTLYELRDLGTFLGLAGENREDLIRKIKATYGSEVKGVCTKVIKR